VFYLGEGVVFDQTAATGTPPDFQSWLQYCDQMIGYPFSNEGSLLGLQSAVGSYAQAEVKERRFLRSAPKYHRAFVEPINEQIIKPLCDDQIPGDPLLEYPRLELSTSRFSDASSWIADVRAVLGPNVPWDQWPDEFKAVAREKLLIDAPEVDVVDDLVTFNEGDADG